MQSPPFPRYLIPPRSKYSPQHIFSNTLSFLSSLAVSDQASHPYKTTGKIIVLYILVFKFLAKCNCMQLYYDKSLAFSCGYFMYKLFQHQTVMPQCTVNRFHHNINTSFYVVFSSIESEALMLPFFGTGRIRQQWADE